MPIGSEGNIPASLAEEFLRNSRQELRTRRERIETCLRKLTEEQIWARRHENENAIGNLVLHLCGNVRQWIIGSAEFRFTMSRCCTPSITLPYISASTPARSSGPPRALRARIWASTAT